MSDNREPLMLDALLDALKFDSSNLGHLASQAKPELEKLREDYKAAITLLGEVISGTRNSPVRRAIELLAKHGIQIRENTQTYVTMREERDLAKAILVDVINKGTDGGATDTVSLEFLKFVPAECALVKQERNSLREVLIGISEACVPAPQSTDGTMILCGKQASMLNNLVALLRSYAASVHEKEAKP